MFFHKKLIFTLITFVFALNGFSQTIVNTEKLLSDTTGGFAFSSELFGNALGGNAQLYFLEGSLNTSYKKNKHLFRVFSGGEYVYESNEVVANNLFGQFRYNYLVNDKISLFSFYQLQSNNILLLTKRQLLGGGSRFTLLNLEKDSTLDIKFDLSGGMMYEEEVLNANEIGSADIQRTQLPRMLLSGMLKFDIHERFSIINTIYFQGNVLDLNDYRLFYESNLLYALNSWLNISIDFEYRFDSEPPSVLKDQDFNTNIGFMFEF